MKKLLFSFIIIHLFDLLRAQQTVPLLPADTFAINKNKEQALICINLGDKKEESRCYDQIAFIYWEHNLFKEAAYYYHKSLDLNNQLHNESGVSMINSNLGLIYADLRQYDTSLLHFQNTLAYRKMIKEKTGIISTLINISVVLNNLSQFDKSVSALNEALTLAREMNDIDQMKSCYGMLSETYEKAKQPDKAQYYFELYRTFHEKLIAEKVKSNKKALQESELRLKLVESEKQNKELQLKLTTSQLEDKENQLSESEIAKQSLYKKYTKAELQKHLLEKENQLKQSLLEKHLAIQQKQENRIILLSIIVILVLMILAFLFNFYRQKQRLNRILGIKNQLISQQKRDLEIQQNNLRDSINYALYIQNATFKSNISLREIIKDHFVFFKPLATVSGDFYWFSKTDNKLVIVAADCSGHGVPGALLTLIGTNLLNRIVENENKFMPNEILLELNTGIIKTLDQQNNDNHDGMDAAICTIDFNTNKLHFAGARMPLVYISDGELNIIKGDKASLGGSQDQLNVIGKFDLHSLDISSSFKFYLFSDGYHDQINEEYKKLTTKKFISLISQYNHLPMPEQKKAFENFFNSWKDKAEQIDDVMLLGFSVK